MKSTNDARLGNIGRFETPPETYSTSRAWYVEKAETLGIR
jgi:hypothetical protein